jgi:hypothetical protein
MPAKSFIQVLEEHIRRDLMKELCEEYRSESSTAAATVRKPIDPQGRLETWLATNIGKAEFSRARQGQRQYASLTKKPSTHTPVPEAHTTEPRRELPLSFEELCALELLNRASDRILSASFSRAELKASWRRAALRTHPDRFVTTDPATQKKRGEEFASLVEAFELLDSSFDQ